MRACPLTVLAITVGVVRLAAAGVEDAERLLSEGVELRRRHRDLEALERFQGAYAIRREPRTRSQIGFAEQALGRWAEAERDLKGALEEGGEWVDRNRATIGRALAVIDERLGTLEIEGSPTGAEVRVDRSAVGTLPLRGPLRVAAGSVAVEVAARGHLTALRSVLINAHTSHRERIDLVPLPTAAAEPGVREAVVQREPGPHDRRLWVGGWLVGALGVGLLGLGGAGSGLREASAARWNSDSCVGNGMTRLESCGGALDSVHTGEQLAVVGFVAGGVLVVTAVALWAADTIRRRSAR